ncbi:Tfp pilus assembly protein PilF [Massilia sp. CF038]|nr:Tfp pilus assembly protein PilF [Massilia sp. CF038]
MQALRKAESAKKDHAAVAAAVAESTPPEVAADAAAPAPSAELTLEVQEPTREQIDTAKEVAAQAQAAPADVTAPAPLSAPAAESVDYFSSEVPPPRTPYVPPESAAPAPSQGFDPDRGFVAPAPVPPVAPAVARAPAAAPAQATMERKDAQADAERSALEARTAAAAVFAAKQQGGRHQRSLILAACGLLLLSATGAYLYYQYMRIAPQPLALPPAPPPVVVAVQPEPAAAQPALPAAPSEPAATPVEMADGGVKTPPVVAATPVTAAPPVPKPATAAPAAPASVQEVAPRTVARAPARSNPPAAGRAAVSTPGIELRRTDSARQVNPVLTSAYQAFMAGDADSARSQYQRVLQQEPDNRDALLGMAAIAVNRGQSAEAGSFYARLVELDPTDAEAASGLASVQRSEPDQAESNLKKVLAASPHSGPAYFALGNVYAQQQRWPEAQQAYFQAVGAAPGNADYVFNLAVSLDRLGQKKLALEHYKQTLQLAQPGSNVSRDTVQNRIAQLQKDLAAPAAR